MLVSFGFGFYTASYILPWLSEANSGQAFCHTKKLTLDEKNKVIANSEQYENPFYENMYGKINIKSISDFYINIRKPEHGDFNYVNPEVEDLYTFSKIGISPWLNNIYFQSKKGFYQYKCVK